MPDRTLTAFFEDRRQAQRAVDELNLAGFGEDQVSMGGNEHSFLDAILPRGDRERDERTKVTVTGPRQLEAASILHQLGGQDEATPRSGPEGAGDQVIELLVEEAVPQVVPVSIGEVRIVKVVHTETRTVEVPVRREELVVERLPVSAAERDEAAAGGDDHGDNSTMTAGGAHVVRESVASHTSSGDEEPLAPAGSPASLLGADEEVIRVPLLEEQVVITLRPVVREEVLVRKRRVSESQVHSVDVRNEVLHVDRTGEAEVEEHQLSSDGHRLEVG